MIKFYYNVITGLEGWEFTEPDYNERSKKRKRPPVFKGTFAPEPKVKKNKVGRASARESRSNFSKNEDLNLE